MIAVGREIRQWLKLVDRVHAPVRAVRRRGHPYVYSSSVLLRCYLLMLVYPKARSYSGLVRFLAGHRLVRRLVGLKTMPHRTTFSRRLKAMDGELRLRIRAMGAAFITAGFVEVHVLLADGSLHQAAGPEWPSRWQKRGEMPKKLRHVDRAAGWGKSPYHGWVWGYRSHPVVGLTADQQPIPLAAVAGPANLQDNTLLRGLLPELPAEATVLVLDSSYEDQALVNAWTEHDDAGVLTRWLVIDPKKRKGRPAAWRQQLQVWRQVEEVDLYRLRSKRIEPFFAHWKEAFDLDRLPLQGAAAVSYLLLALYAYQLLIWANHHHDRPLFAYQWLFDPD
jgi:Transposase DDE domain